MGCDFVDYFSVAKVDGRWVITNKTYAHTGGHPARALIHGRPIRGNRVVPAGG